MKIVAKTTKIIVEYSVWSITAYDKPNPTVTNAISPLAIIPYPTRNPFLWFFSRKDAGIPHPKILLNMATPKIPRKTTMLISNTSTKFTRAPITAKNNKKNEKKAIVWILAFLFVF